MSHPNIVKIFGFVENFNEDTAWLVFEQAEHGNIRKFLEEGTWDIPERINLVRPISSTLSSRLNYFDADKGRSRRSLIPAWSSTTDPPWRPEVCEQVVGSVNVLKLTDSPSGECYCQQCSSSDNN